MNGLGRGRGMTWVVVQCGSGEASKLLMLGILLLIY